MAFALKGSKEVYIEQGIKVFTAFPLARPPFSAPSPHQTQNKNINKTNKKNTHNRQKRDILLDENRKFKAFGSAALNTLVPCTPTSPRHPKSIAKHSTQLFY